MQGLEIPVLGDWEAPEIFAGQPARARWEWRERSPGTDRNTVPSLKGLLPEEEGTHNDHSEKDAKGSTHCQAKRGKRPRPGQQYRGGAQLPGAVQHDILQHIPVVHPDEDAGDTWLCKAPPSMPHGNDRLRNAVEDDHSRRSGCLGREDLLNESAAPPRLIEGDDRTPLNQRNPVPSDLRGGQGRRPKLRARIQGLCHDQRTLQPPRAQRLHFSLSLLWTTSKSVRS